MIDLYWCPRPESSDSALSEAIPPGRCALRCVSRDYDDDRLRAVSRVRSDPGPHRPSAGAAPRRVSPGTIHRVLARRGKGATECGTDGRVRNAFCGSTRSCREHATGSFGPDALAPPPSNVVVELDQSGVCSSRSCCSSSAVSASTLPWKWASPCWRRYRTSSEFGSS